MMHKTIAGLFDNPRDAHAVVADLERNGFPRGAITLVARPKNRSAREIAAEDIITEKYAATGVRSVAGAVTGGLVAVILFSLAFAGLSPSANLPFSPALTLLLVAIGGAIVGGIVGARTHAGLSKDEAALYAEGVQRGLALVAVNSGDVKKARIAEHIMHAHHVLDIDTAGHIQIPEPSPPFEQAQGARVYDFYGAMSGRPTGAAAPTRSGRPPLDQGAPPGQLSGELGAYTYPERQFRAHYDQYYRGISGAYEDYAPAYRYGYGLARRLPGASRNWDALEAEAASGWERMRPGTWEQYRAVVRKGCELADTQTHNEGAQPH